ncbi:GIY-YIG nuclease family protein [Candidatus Saccharibacteria bacterium]|nr:GIY-YIG nuclease family protein [Candidatus Saccharibacteria bacterium]MCB9821519.1 GIY-YIG nuclease family protein [Candidatus Nomurabacteria bacterium]
MHYVYVLSSVGKPGWHYYGSTSDLQRRYAEHIKGMVKSTSAYKPLKLVYYEAYLTKQMAAEREKQLKKSRSATKALLSRIRPDLGE